MLMLGYSGSAQKVSNNNFNPKGTITGKIMIIDIARRKHSADPSQCGDCKCGLGVCRFCFFCDKGTTPITQELNILKDYNSEFVEIQLLDKTQDGVDYNFYLDDNVFADDNLNLFFAKGIYTLDTSIGRYGGYRLVINTK